MPSIKIDSFQNAFIIIFIIKMIKEGVTKCVKKTNSPPKMLMEIEFPVLLA
jgi:hypothetical protein